MDDFIFDSKKKCLRHRRSAIFLHHNVYRYIIRIIIPAGKGTLPTRIGWIDRTHRIFVVFLHRSNRNQYTKVILLSFIFSVPNVIHILRLTFMFFLCCSKWIIIYFEPSSWHGCENEILIWGCSSNGIIAVEFRPNYYSHLNT